MKLQSYKDLIVWQKLTLLVKNIYKICSYFPKTELYSLSNQMQRSAISIPSNIAEGWARNHKLEFARFLSIAYASAAELETQIIIAKDQYPAIDYLSADNLLPRNSKDAFCINKKY